MFTVELIMVIILWAHNPISFNYVLCWHLLLEPHESPYHSDVGVWLREVYGLGTSTLMYGGSYVVTRVNHMLRYEWYLYGKTWPWSIIYTKTHVMCYDKIGLYACSNLKTQFWVLLSTQLGEHLSSLERKDKSSLWINLTFGNLLW